ncbi:MAG: N-acetylmuramoyl-L-alanine amidase AmiC [Chlamydiales bacterium]|nr:N-acetylmuramoyl-L-alanine amidase AmiC [Chlamydiales bacterium]MCH9620017.1 N-acetylmuramoyl-L-alanine amidase AmiC [Chlamydiales bacterium]MCH9622879.1 N-acetylmuramoyl-L-alanine amidase AmiC [Chlamydiales bacterium]
MKRFFCLGLLLVATSCGVRKMPPEIAAIKDEKVLIIPKREEVIVIDAGHGGHDPGSNSKWEEYEEKKLTLSTAFLVQEHLEKLGYQVVLTRNHDTYVPLKKRAEIANHLHANLFVSIHYNYSQSDDVQGVEVYYYRQDGNSERIAQSKELARRVLTSTIDWTHAKSRGVKQANFAVIRETEMPAILIEAGFLSNSEERKRLKDPHYQRQLSWAIARGIDRYFH